MATKITRKNVVEEKENSNFLGSFEITAYDRAVKFQTNSKQIVTFVNSKGDICKAELSAGAGYEDSLIIPEGTLLKGLRVAALKCDEHFLMGGIPTHRTVRFVLQRRHDTSQCVMSADDL